VEAAIIMPNLQEYLYSLISISSDLYPTRGIKQQHNLPGNDPHPQEHSTGQAKPLPRRVQVNPTNQSVNRNAGQLPRLKMVWRSSEMKLVIPDWR